MLHHDAPYIYIFLHHSHNSRAVSPHHHSAHIIAYYCVSRMVFFCFIVVVFNYNSICFTLICWVYARARRWHSYHARDLCEL